MDEYQIIISLAVAMGVGLLIGLQREQSARVQNKSDKTFIGGIRTYPLFAIAGALAALAASSAGVWVVAAAMIALMVPVSLAYFDGIRQGGDRGITSETALVVTFLLGVLSVSDQVVPMLPARLLLVAGISVVVTGILALKEPLHSLASKFSPDDMYTTVKFLVLAVIVLPLLPNENLGPLNAINPFNVGLMIVFLAGMGLVGYVLVRVLGPQRGLGLAGLAGGIASSTAVTAAMSRQAKRQPENLNACLLAVMLASAAMPIRLLVEVSAVYSPMTWYVAPPMIALVIFALMIAFYFYRRNPQQKSEHVDLRNPLELRTALYFGILFAIIMPVSKAAAMSLGSRGLLLSAAVSGSVDLDAITLSLANMARGQVADPWLATKGILLAAAANTAVKAALAFILGGWSFGWRVTVAFALTFGAAGATMVAFKLFM